jgi:hypothetical protein
MRFEPTASFLDRYPPRDSWNVPMQNKYGLSWQVQSRLLIELLGHPDRAKTGRVMNAMMKMTKIDIAALQAAAAGS